MEKITDKINESKHEERRSGGRKSLVCDITNTEMVEQIVWQWKYSVYIHMHIHAFYWK